MQTSPLQNRLRDFRRERGLTQAQLAAALSVSPITVLRWENGSSRPSAMAARQLEGLGFGALGRHETKQISIARSADPTISHDLRQGIRPYLNVDGTELPFTPAPYVLNGPEDQLSFFETLYSLQEEPLSKGLVGPDRLALVAAMDGLDEPPSQAQLERATPKAKSWRGTYGTHGVHRYVGRFPPHLVRTLLNHFGLRQGDLVLDPFLGSGTTLVEARLLGIRGRGLDVCPLSTMISRAKTQFPANPAEVSVLGEILTAFYEERWAAFITSCPEPSHADVMARQGNAIPEFANIERWFTPLALLGTSIVVEFAMGLRDYERDLVATCLSAQMRSIGNVDVDVVRAEYRKSPRNDVDVLKLVLRKLQSMVAAMRDSVSTHRRTIGLPEDIVVHEKSVLRAEIENNSVDAIITSPPYGVESLSYLRTHLLSYRALAPILNHDVYAWNEEIIGSEFLNAVAPVVEHRAAKVSRTYSGFFQEVDEQLSKNEQRRLEMMMQFFDDMTTTSQRMARWLRPGGRLAFVIGNKRLGGRVIPTDQIMREIFAAVGLSVDGVISHKLKTNNSNSEVPWQERVIQEENVLICTKDSRGVA